MMEKDSSNISIILKDVFGRSLMKQTTHKQKNTRKMTRELYRVRHEESLQRRRRMSILFRGITFWFRSTAIESQKNWGAFEAKE
jgi:hypothetical protein